MRPKPEILLRTGNEDGTPETRVISAKGVYLVLYKGKPFNLTTDRSPEGQPPIYRRTTYPHKKSAVNLAASLNKLFEVEDFTVSEWVVGPNSVA